MGQTRRVNNLASRYQQPKNQPHGLVSLSEYIENCRSNFSYKLVNKIHLRIFALFTLQKVMFTISFQSVEKTAGSPDTDSFFG